VHRNFPINFFRLHEIEAEFYKHVSMAEVAGSAALLEVDQPTIEAVYNYWKLKRRAANNAPLLPFRSDDSDTLHRLRGQQDLEKMRLFVQLRQDLERVCTSVLWDPGEHQGRLRVSGILDSASLL